MKRLFGEDDKRFRALINNIVDVIAILSVDGRFTYSSPSVVNALGYTVEELAGKNAFGMLHPGDLPRATKLFAQILINPGKSFFTQLRYRHKDGSWLWLEGTAVNLLGDPGIRGVVVNYRDVTKRKLEEEKTRERAEQMSALYNTTQDLVMERNQQRLLGAIVERAVGLMNAKSGGLYLCEPERSQVRCVVSYRTPRDFTGTILRYGEGAAGVVATTGEPLIIDDYRVWRGRARQFDQDEPFTAILSIPIKYQKEMMGVLHILDDHQTRKFNETDLQIATLFANQASVAVANARLIEQVQDHAANLEQRTMELSRSNSLLASLHSIAAGLSVSREPEEILNILSAELKHLGIGHEITLYDPKADQLIVQLLSVDTGILKKIETLAGIQNKGFRIPASAPFLSELLETGEARFVNDPVEVTLSLPLGIPKPIIQQAFKLVMGSSSLPSIYLPLKVHERKIGLMAVWGDYLKPEDVDTFVVFVSQVAMALDNSLLLSSEHSRAVELTRSNTLLASLHRIAAGLMASYGSDEILSIISTELKRLEIGHGITLYDSETNELVSQYVSVESGALKKLEKLLGRRVNEWRVGNKIKGARTSATIPLIAELLESGTARFMEDFLSVLSAIPVSIPRPLLREAFNLVMDTSSMPIILLPLKVRDRKLGLMAVWGRDLKPEDVDIFVVFVAQVAMALDNSRLMDLERQRAMELEKKVAERTRQLESLLQEKGVLLREVYHRVKNNLQVINSLLNLQAPRLETESDRQIIGDVHERVRAIALVHEKLYQSGDLARVDFSEYIQSLVENLARVYLDQVGEIPVTVKVDQVWLGLDTAVPCGLIVNELVANSFKHAFPDSHENLTPEIVVEMHADRDGRYTLRVSDNGVGMPGGLDWSNVPTMGLQLVTMLIEQLNGEVHVLRDGGTTFNISFSEMKYKERG